MLGGLRTRRNAIHRLLSVWETGMPPGPTPETLEKAGLYDFGFGVDGPVPAHPKFDPANGDLLFFGHQPSPPYVTWYRVDRAGRPVESGQIDTKLPSRLRLMMHDIIATDHYAA
jgi:carotenoid cleavage dioxygenase-like enzyme